MSVVSSSTGRRPTYAEGQIKDEHVGVEMLLVSTVVSSREVGCGGPPEVRVDNLTTESDIERDTRLSSRPEPNLDSILLATGEGIVSTSNRVEIFAIRIRLGGLSSATLVEVEVGVAIRRGGVSVNTPVSDQRNWRADEQDTHPS